MHSVGICLVRLNKEHSAAPNSRGDVAPELISRFSSSAGDLYPDLVARGDVKAKSSYKFATEISIHKSNTQSSY